MIQILIKFRSFYKSGSKQIYEINKNKSVS